MSLASIIDSINTELALIPLVTLAIGEKSLAGNHRPRRYVWVPGDASPVGGKKRDGITEAVGALDWAVDVHCWGTNLGDAERMVAALLTAARKQTDGNVRIGRLGPLPVESSYSQDGYVLVVSLVLIVQLLKQDLATMTDFSHTTVTITVVDFDSTTASPTDGVIDVGDIAL